MGQRILALEQERERVKEEAVSRVDVVGSIEGEGVGGRWQVVGSGRDKKDFEKAGEGGEGRGESGVGDEKEENAVGEMKKLRTELAVERNNRSLVAKELQQVGKEKDEFMQIFMELERELRSRHRSASESVMTTSTPSLKTSAGSARSSTEATGGQQT